MNKGGIINSYFKTAVIENNIKLKKSIKMKNYTLHVEKC